MNWSWLLPSARAGVGRALHDVQRRHRGGDRIHHVRGIAHGMATQRVLLRASDAGGSLNYRDIPHKDIIQQDLEECNTCDGRTLLSLGGTKYTSCAPEPFGGEPITLQGIKTNITSPLLNGDPSAITVVSFPCMTESSQSVFFVDYFEFPNLAEVRFANWVTGPDGFFKVRTLLLPFLSHLLLRALPYVLLQ